MTFGHAVKTMALIALLPVGGLAGEADLVIPDMSADPMQFQLLCMGGIICLLGIAFGCREYLRIAKLRAHASMLAVSRLIYATCRTYMLQQGKFLLLLEIFVAV